VVVSVDGFIVFLVVEVELLKGAILWGCSELSSGFMACLLAPEE
jgi:hypothetical protein